MRKLNQEVYMTSRRIQQIEGANQKMEKELQLVNEQNKELCQSVTLLEWKIMESYLRLRGIPEEEEENIYEIVLEKIAHFLEKQPEDISFNIEAVYRVNSNYVKQRKLLWDVVVWMIEKKIKDDIIEKN